MSTSSPRVTAIAGWLRRLGPCLPLTVLVACASAPSAAPERPRAAAAPVDLATKVSWMLRLEQERVLRVDGVAPVVDPPAGAAPGFFPATTADLAALVVDPEASMRRRAALALGRVGLPEGLPLVTARLDDPDEAVREAAAFAIGLLGRQEAVPTLVDRLRAESSFRVRGRLIDALGLLGDESAAGPIAAASTGCGVLLSPIAPDDMSPQSREVEACRLALFALVRLGNVDALRSVALDAGGQAVSRWWPVAYALQRGGAPDAPALLALVSTSGIYTPAFALRALAALEDARVIPLATALVDADVDVKLRVAALRALVPFASSATAPVALRLLRDPAVPPNLLLEAVPLVAGDGAFDLLVDLFAHPWAALRVAAMRRAAALDSESFLVVRSSFGDDPDWSVRAALVDIVSGLGEPAERVMGWIEAADGDRDVRVRVAALQAFARLNAPDLDARLATALSAPDYSLRAAAARLTGQRRPDGGVLRLSAAYVRGESDAADGARSAAIAAVARYDGEEARVVLRRALDDREWPVRLQAARLLEGLGEPATPRRPAPVRQPAGFFESDALLRPPFSPHAFIETRLGTIEIALNVIEAAVTTRTFIELARSGFYNGLRVHRLIPHFVIQVGDPRGDGSGGPGFTQRDELSPLPFVRGTVGMALSGPDTGGSQFFITLSPQPHLDGRYTVFGQVVSGDEMLDRVAMWDVIERVRIWDGVTLR
ncbi:MAG TPA: peptidylprolyl isomerase [Vicinamibacterales bacterium]|nr:peptidylprolyl isomerase [Vicinamibacterales bacterium]